MQIGMQFVHSTRIGYGSLGVGLFAALEKLGVDVVSPELTPEMMDDGKLPKTNSILWVTVPSHARGYWEGSHPWSFTMWESGRLPETFLECLDEFAGIIVPNTYNLKQFSEHHENVHLVPLGIDPDVWKPKDRTVGAFLDFLICGAGERKGTDLAVAAFKLAFPKPEDMIPTPRLVMKNHKENYWGPTIIRISQRLSDEDLVALYESCHVYVQPCFSADTKAVTPSGFKHHSELRVGDEVMTFNPKTNQLEAQPIKRVYRSHYKGEMVHFANVKMDLLVTPNHRIYYQGFSGGRRTREWKVREAGEFVGTSTRYHLPVAWEPRPSEATDPFLSDFAFVTGWYLAEGSTYRDPHNYRVSFSNTERVEIERLQETLFRLGLKSSIYTDQRRAKPCHVLTVGSNKWLWTLLRDTCGQYQKDRRVPEWLLDAPREALMRCYEAMMIGDGSDKPHHRLYYTSSEKLMETFVLLCAKLGYGTKAYFREQSERHIEGRTLKPTSNWMISISEERHEGTIKTGRHVTTEPYDDEVWCVETENSTVITARNGLICGSGNSRGEGWGLQPHQALATGMPTILSDIPGHQEYGWVPGASFTPTVRKPSSYFIYGDAGDWWEPSLEALIEQYRDFYDNYPMWANEAMKGSEIIRARFTWQQCAEGVIGAIGREELGLPYRGEGRWVPAPRRKYQVITIKDWAADIAGLHYFFKKGKVYHELSDVKRILWEAGLLDPACLVDEALDALGEPIGHGLTDRQVAELNQYSARFSTCPQCFHPLNHVCPHCGERCDSLNGEHHEPARLD